MPGSTLSGGDAPPSVPLSFSNNFWGRDDAGVDPLLTRMANAKTTCDELKSFYAARAAIEDDYARKLAQLSRKPLGSVEQGTLRSSLDVARGETEAMSKQHALIAQQMKSECEEPLGAFAGGMKERRKIVQNGIEKLLKTKQGQTSHVNKCRDKFEQDSLRIKGYLAQGHMVMGQEERKNKAKLEKTQINMATNSSEYESAVKVLEETTGRWNKEWKAACDKFQDLEEELCVSDDASCEKVRLALEKCEVEKDISSFIKTSGTGQEIPDPPKYINFCRGDIDSASEVSQDEDYTVAQFARTTNPAFRTCSPKPAAMNGSDLSQRYSEEPEMADDDQATPQKANSGRPPPLNYRQGDPNVPPDYSPSQHGPVVGQIPHNQYPTEGMTMFCRADGPSRAETAPSVDGRPSSRDDTSEYSAPSSFTSADPASRTTSPTKNAPVNGVGLPGMSSPMPSPDKAVQKKRSGFFSNSPFRRKSKKEKEAPELQKRSTWDPKGNTRINLNASDVSSSSAQSSPTKPHTGRNLFNRNAAPEGEEPADPRASFQLNVGNNVFDVGNPDSHQSTPRASSNNARLNRFNQPPAAAGSDMSMDPIARALADLKSNGGSNFPSKQASTREPVDRYHGVKSPAPDMNPSERPGGMTADQRAHLLAQGRTPPPAYDLGGPSPAAGHARSQSSVLGVPQPAHTRKEMLDRSKQWGNGGSAQASPARPVSRNGDGRRSPGPGMVPRAASPQPGYGGAPQMRARSPGPGMMQQTQGAYQRAASPSPYANAGNRPHTQSSVRQGSGMEMQLSSQDVARYGDSGSGRSRAQMAQQQDQRRPQSSYGGDPYAGRQGGGGGSQSSSAGMRRERSKSMGPPPGRAPQVLYYARAVYSYNAAIPEELSFAKGDILGVLRLQDDGWWEAEVRESQKGTRLGGGGGLVPSNYLQRC
ncbi:Septation protein imp2 [Cyphellophora attinorum]|uniref:Septation protein imp2 n=1 Tax=Cyphellophora attinorum TaxID=1664694 RepID=A0A0N1P0P7_9EURO|nr:Septation protein imp2 [Phialophora attinorum]KPI43902.1 Septation protein imp2 [Phialophora attinorum]